MTPFAEQPGTEPHLRQEVLAWFVRRHGDVWSVEEEAAFTAWLQADSANRDAYQRWSTHWKALDAMPADAVATLQKNLERDKAILAHRSSVGRKRDATGPHKTGRRAFLLPAFSLAAVTTVAVGTGYLAWRHMQAQPVFAQAFSTRRGQQMEVPLPDGSRLRLDTATRLQVVYFRQRREVRLLEGQAFFTAQRDATRPFDVMAGPVRVTVVGTRFAVRHTPGMPGAEGVTVYVEEGKVRVGRSQDAAEGVDRTSAVYLMAGQQVESDASGTLAPVSGVRADGIATWRENRISFVDTPLARALAELDRYADTGLVVRDPAVARLRLTGTFDPRDASLLRRLLPSALPVRLRSVGGVTEVVTAR